MIVLAAPIDELPGSEALLQRGERGQALARFIEVSRPTILLGRRQDEAAVDAPKAARLGWDLRRRVTPGGLVYMDSSAVCLELALPASHPAFTTDVLQATKWFGAILADALNTLGLRGELAASNSPPGPGLASQACFGSWVRGEVLLGGRKVFGTAQYRRRSGALFQSVALIGGSHGRIATVLPGSPDARSEAAAAIEQRSVPLTGASRDSLSEAIQAALAHVEVAFAG